MNYSFPSFSYIYSINVSLVYAPSQVWGGCAFWVARMRNPGAGGGVASSPQGAALTSMSPGGNRHAVSNRSESELFFPRWIYATD